MRQYMGEIRTMVNELGDRDEEVGGTQLFGLPRTAPLSLVRELLTYALAVEKGYRTGAALAADGYEFAPEGPAWYDGDGDAEYAGWAWDYNRELPAAPAYTVVR